MNHAELSTKKISWGFDTKNHSEVTELTLFGKTRPVNNTVGLIAMAFIMPITLFVGGVMLLSLFLLSKNTR